jgi:hypothetical protein
VLHGFLVARATVSGNHSFKQRRPAEIVDVIEGGPGHDQRADDFLVAEMGRGDEGRATEGAGDTGALPPHG